MPVTAQAEPDPRQSSVSLNFTLGRKEMQTLSFHLYDAQPYIVGAYAIIATIVSLIFLPWPGKLVGALVSIVIPYVGALAIIFYAANSAGNVTTKKKYLIRAGFGMSAILFVFVALGLISWLSLLFTA
jgi:hypothetical protein